MKGLDRILRGGLYRSRNGGFLINDADKNMYHIPKADDLATKDLINIERYC